MSRLSAKSQGVSSPLGATVYPEGVNFSLFCKNGSSVCLLFFDGVEDVAPNREIILHPTLNRTYHYWHIFVRDVQPGQLYAYRIDGPLEPARGLLYDPDKILLDPYAKAVAVPRSYTRRSFAGRGRAGCPSLKSVVVDLSTYDWEGDTPIGRPFSQTIIYELHVGGFTRDKSSGVEEPLRGKFAGIAAKIPYLVELGITAVELMPVFQFDVQDAPEGLVNYWGYSPVSFFAPHQGYGSGKDSVAVLDEFRNMVKSLHAAGIEVILDVVYNHTGEGDLGGPTLGFRGIDNSVYYLLDEEGGAYRDFSGCGNTMNGNQAVVRRMIIDSLHFWAGEMHVDGFRFDLASILARDDSGREIANPPVLWDIESDPVLSGVKLIAEAWDAAGLYQVGRFVGDSWKEWNGKFRDDLRRFLRGEEGVLSEMVTRLIGSPDLYGHSEREPEQSINFVTCHDGFTLRDLVSYDRKHNELNKEGNKDGTDDNCSWNCGVEGETEDPEILRLRNRQVKNFFALTLLAIGAPMISMGDEIGRTQSGNNNAYCQDNPVSWLDWDLKNKYGDLFRFVRLLIDGRRQRDSAHPEFNLSLNELLSHSQIAWHGVRVNQPDWGRRSHAIAFTVQSLGRQSEYHFMINAYWEALDFELPPTGAGGPWKRWIDTSLTPPDDICHWHNAPRPEEKTYHVPSRSVVVLVSFTEQQQLAGSA